MEPFQIFGNDYLIVANHFNDVDGILFGYITTSTIYFWDRSLATGPRYVPIQAVETFGAADVEIFSIDDTFYLAIANYYNGTSYEISSPVYSFTYTEDMVGLGQVESSVPFLNLVQQLPTIGSRSVKHVVSGPQHFLVVSNEQNHSIAVFRWNGTRFEQASNFLWEAPGRIALLDSLKFFVQGDLAPVLAVASRGNASAVVCLTSNGDLILAASLPSGPATEVQYFSSAGYDFVAVLIAPSKLTPHGGTAIFQLTLSVDVEGTKLSVQIATVLPSNMVGALHYYEGSNLNDGVLIEGSGWGSGGINTTSLILTTMTRQASRVGISAVDNQTVILFGADVMTLRDPVAFNTSLENLIVQAENMAGLPVYLKNSSIPRGVCFTFDFHAYTGPDSVGVQNYPATVQNPLWTRLNEYGSALLAHIRASSVPCSYILVTGSAPGLQAQILRVYSSPGFGFPAILRIPLKHVLLRPDNVSSNLFEDLQLLNGPQLRFLSVSYVQNVSTPSFDVQYIGQNSAAALAIGNALTKLNISIEFSISNHSESIGYLMASARPPPNSFFIVENISDPFPASLRSFAVVLQSQDCTGNRIPFPLDGQKVVATVNNGSSQVTLGNNFAVALDGMVVFTDLVVVGGGINIQIEFSCSSNCELGPASLKVNVSEKLFQHNRPALSLDFMEGASTTVLSSGLILIFGGQALRARVPSNRLLSLDPGGFNLTTLLPQSQPVLISPIDLLPAPRSQHAACAVNMSLYVHGGLGTIEPLAGFYKFDLSEKKWTNLSNLPGEPSARFGHAMSTAVNYIVVFGGIFDYENIDLSLHIFSLASLTWSKLSAPSTYRPVFRSAPFSMFAFGSSVYLCETWDAFYVVDLNSFSWQMHGTQSDNKTRAVLQGLEANWTSVAISQVSGASPRIISIVKENSGSQSTTLSKNASNASTIRIIELSADGPRQIPIFEAENFAQYLTIVESGVKVAEGRVLFFGLASDGSDAEEVMMISTDPSFTLAFDYDSEEASSIVAMANSPFDPPLVVWALDGNGMRTSWSTAPFTVFAFAYDLSGRSFPLGGSIATASPSDYTEVTFTELSVQAASPGVVLVFKVPGLISKVTNPFNVNAGQAFAVKPGRLPKGIVLGAVFLIQPTAEIVDLDGNNVWTDSFSVVTVGLQYYSPVQSNWTQPADGGLSGNTLAVSRHSLVEWTDLGIMASTMASLGTVGPWPAYRLVFMRSGFENAFSSNFSYTPSSEKALNASLQETVGSKLHVVSGSFLPTFVVSVVLQGYPSLVIIGDNSSVITVSLIPPVSGLSGGRLSGLLVRNVTFGQIAFTNLTVDLLGVGYHLKFSSPSFAASAYSDAFDIVPASASNLFIETYGAGSAAAGGYAAGGEPFWIQPVVLARDPAGNPTSSGGSLVVKANLLSAQALASQVAADANITAGFFQAPVPGSSTAELTGHVAVVVSSNGKATFYDLAINLVGVYQLVFTAYMPGSVIAPASQVIKVSVGPPRLLLIAKQPGLAFGGSPFGIQPIVRATDAGGNEVRNLTALTISAAANPVSYSSSWLALHPQPVESLPIIEEVASVSISAPIVTRTFRTVAGDILVAVVESLPMVTVYRFDNGNLESPTSLAIAGVSDIAYFSPNTVISEQSVSQDYIVVSCQFDQISGYSAASRVYLIDTILNTGQLSFKLTQTLNTAGAVSLTSFDASGQDFVVIACQSDGYESTKVKNLNHFAIFP